MSYNPQPDPQNVVVISAGSSVTEVNRFPVGIGTTGVVSIANTVSISNTSFYVTGVGSTVNVSGTVSVANKIGRAHV